MKYSSNVVIDRLSESMLDCFCLKILPEIHQKIQWLNLESSSMERILLTGNYLTLTGLGLYNISMEKARSVFLGKIFQICFPSLNVSKVLFIFFMVNCPALIEIIDWQKYPPKKRKQRNSFFCLKFSLTSFRCCVRDPSNKRNKQNRYVLINF